MLEYIKVTILSREEIENTLVDIETTSDKIYATYKKKNIDISTFLWEMCGRTIMVLSTARATHHFDYSYLHDVTIDGCRQCPFVYFMKDWLDHVIVDEMQTELTF